MSFKDAVALIKFSLPNGNESRGTGFLVTSKHVLTALHVVAERRASSKQIGQPQPVTFVDPIPLCFSGAGRPERTARVVDGLWDPRQDWALLELDSEVDIAPIAIGAIDGDRGSWRAFGFPDTKPDGMMVEGRVRDSRGSIDGAPALQLFSEEAASGGGMPVRGLSGAPCVVGDTAVGILRWVPMANRATGQAHAGTVFACPLPVVAERCGDHLPAPVRVSDQPAAAAFIGLPVPAPQRPTRPVLLILLVAVIAVSVATTTYLLTRPSSTAPQRKDGSRYVAIREPRIQAGENLPEIELIRAGLRQALLRGATDLSGLAVIAHDDVDTIDDSKTPVSELARALAADEVIVSRLTCSPRLCDVALSWVEVDGAVRQTESFTIEPPDDYRASLDTVVTYLQRGYGDLVPRPAVPELDVSNQDYEKFLRWKRAFDAKAAISEETDQILAELDAIRQRSTGFVDVYLLEAEILRRRFRFSRETGDIERANQLAEAALEIAPGSPRPVKAVLGVALAQRDFPRAEQALRQLEQLEPGSSSTFYRAQLAQERGDLARAIQHYREAARLQPSWRTLIKLGNLESQTGQVAGARATLRRLLEVAPGTYKAQAFQAQMELDHGDLEVAAALYQQLAERHGTIPSYGSLGWIQFCLGRYDDAAKNFERILQLVPRHVVTLVYFGQALELGGRRDDALASYRRALDLLQQDRSATDAHSLAIRASLHARLGQPVDANKLAEQALNEEPGNVDVVSTAATAYALLEDQGKASDHMITALDLGYNGRCFSMPWFDQARGDPRVQQRLQRASDARRASGP